jgi:hypothetical protein
MVHSLTDASLSSAYWTDPSPGVCRNHFSVLSAARRSQVSSSIKDGRCWIHIESVTIVARLQVLSHHTYPNIAQHSTHSTHSTDQNTNEPGGSAAHINTSG